MVDGFSALATASGDPDMPLLERIAHLVVVRSLAATSDPSLELAACQALLVNGSHPCLALIAGNVRNPSVPLDVRLEGAALLRRAGDVAGQELFEHLVDGIHPDRPADVLAAARRAPPSRAIPLLAPILRSPDPGLQFQAVDILAKSPEPGGVAALRSALAADPSMARLPLTHIALARQGDQESLLAVAAGLNDLEGTDLLAAGEVLLARGDDRGLDALRRALMSEDELVALRAARVLAAHNFAEASGVIDAALSSDNVWVRLHAMEASEDVPASPGRSLWEMMKDDDPWVRFRAAAATLVRCRRTTTPDRVLADRP